MKNLKTIFSTKKMAGSELSPMEKCPLPIDMEELSDQEAMLVVGGSTAAVANSTVMIGIVMGGGGTWNVPRDGILGPLRVATAGIVRVGFYSLPERFYTLP